MKVKYVSIFAIILVLMSGLPLFSGPGVINNASAKYAPAESQTQANAKDCNTGTNCAINFPQTQGDGNASSPINLQISKFNEEQDGLGDSFPIRHDIMLKNCRPASSDTLFTYLQCDVASSTAAYGQTVTCSPVDCLFIMPMIGMCTGLPTSATPGPVTINCEFARR
jgi:hypothetical protein